MTVRIRVSADVVDRAPAQFRFALSFAAGLALVVAIVLVALRPAALWWFW